MGAQYKRRVEETHLGSGFGREGREEMVVVEEREDGRPKRAPGGSYIARKSDSNSSRQEALAPLDGETYRGPAGQKPCPDRTKEALSDGIACESRHPELCPNTDFVRIRKQMLGPTKGCGAHSREQKRDYLANGRSVSHETYINLCAFWPVILLQKQKEGEQIVAIVRRRKLGVL